LSGHPPLNRQANILHIIQLLQDLRNRIGRAMPYVTHDIALFAQIADRGGVIYAGQLVAAAPCDKPLSDPVHPYSRGL
ncbi:oligopeptide ABC transporter ATP-binding protein, partial [Pseudomonas sp. GW460-11-11-14-LB11]